MSASPVAVSNAAPGYAEIMITRFLSTLGLTAFGCVALAIALEELAKVGICLDVHGMYTNAVHGTLSGSPNSSRGRSARSMARSCRSARLRHYSGSLKPISPPANRGLHTQESRRRSTE